MSVEIARTSAIAASMLIAFVVAGVCTDAHAETYRVTDIGVPPGYTSSLALAINNAGQVAGVCHNAGGSHALRHTPADGVNPAVLEDLGTFENGSYSVAFGINEAGHVSGDSDTQNAEPRGFAWQGAALVDIVGGNGGANIHAFDLNDAGRIVGRMTNSGSGNPAKFRAILWEEDPDRPGRYIQTTLSVLPGGDPAFSFSDAQAINSLGQIAGESFISDGTSNHAVIWDNDSAHTIIDLPRLAGAGASLVFDINDAGQVVGESYFPFVGSHATLWGPEPDHEAVDLGTLPGHVHSHAEAINASGIAVGTSTADSSATERGVVFLNGRAWDLTALLDPSESGWTIISAQDINDAGQIAATARRNGSAHAVVLTPVTTTAVGDDAPPAGGKIAALGPNFPNPFRDATALSFTLARPAPVSLTVHDAAGRLVARIAEGARAAGEHVVEWNGRDASAGRLASGTYFIRLETPGETLLRRVTIVR